MKISLLSLAFLCVSMADGTMSHRTLVVAPPETNEHETCPEFQNLGNETGSSSDFERDFPPLALLTSGQLANPDGRDDSISFLVGGTYTSQQAAEIEGKIVVLGDFIVEPQGVNSLVQAGIGSGIIPNDDSVVMTVGGSIEFNRSSDTTVMVDTPIGGDVLHGGTYTTYSTGNIVVKPGRTISQGPVDLTKYQDLFVELKAKSEYWVTLPANGQLLSAIDNFPLQNKLVFSAGDSNCLQVFQATISDLVSTSWVIDAEFDSSLTDKTILINVIPDDIAGEKVSEIDLWGKVFDTSGGFDDTGSQSSFFSPALKASILWNFPNTDKVILGPAGGPQFPGSILIPSGSLEMYMPGQGGRTIVGKDLYHDRTGSEFHNYEFDPPCHLPLPPDLPPPEECEECEITQVHTGSNKCPGSSIVSVVSVQAGDAAPNVPGGTDLIYNIAFGGTSAAPTVSFNVENPFDFDVDMYIEYHDSTREYICTEDINRPGCDPNASTIVARCLSRPDVPYTLVTVNFVAPNPLFGNGSGEEVSMCCEVEPGTDGDPVISYGFAIQCDCPNTSQGRFLRH